ncbi:MAG: hypothetical protein IPM34_10465 [Saprospiraceae bacterium]|nr:hypothetical protein [Saprospiraceae bacterium]
MILSTAHQVGQKERDTTHMQGNAARRSLNALFSEMYKPATQKWLTRHLPNTEDSHGLHLTGENSEDSFPLTEFQEHECIPLAWSDMFNLEAGQAYDFAYARIWGGNLPGLTARMQALRQNLKAGGHLLLEFVSLSGFSAYPYNHALARSMELIDMLETPRPSAALLPERIQLELQQAGFDTLEIISTLPAFIPHTNNRVITLALEAFRETILHCRESTAEEINALLIELREFEKQGDTLISRPGMLQVFARQNDPKP